MTLHGLYDEQPLPSAAVPANIGSYNEHTKSGGGGRWDEVLEYRVWIKDTNGLYMNEFAEYEEAHDFAIDHYVGGVYYIHLVVLIRQHWQVMIMDGKIAFNDEETITEWQPEWLLKSQEFSTFSQEEILAMELDGRIEQYMENLR